MFEKHHDPRIRALERGTVYFIVVLIAIVLTEIMKFSKVMFLLEKKNLWEKNFWRLKEKGQKDKREIKYTFSPIQILPLDLDNILPVLNTQVRDALPVS